MRIEKFFRKMLYKHAVQNIVKKMAYKKDSIEILVKKVAQKTAAQDIVWKFFGRERIEMVV